MVPVTKNDHNLDVRISISHGKMFVVVVVVVVVGIRLTCFIMKQGSL
jgi:hypothetical protein